MNKYEVFCVDVFLFITSLLGRKKKRPQDVCFMQKETEGQMSHKVNSPVSDEGLVSGNEERDPGQQEVFESPFSAS